MKRAFIIITAFLLFLPNIVLSATYYCSPSGGGSGANFSNLKTLPDTTGFEAGSTYVVVEGSYGSKTISSANVIVRKANITDDSGVTGWSTSLADGEAIFGTITVNADGITIDGKTRTESNWAADTYGFRISSIYISTFNTSGNVCYDNFTVRYSNLGGEDGNEVDEAIYVGGFHNACDNWTIEKNWLHEVSHYTIIQGVKLTNSTIQYNRFSDSEGKEAIRGQLQFSGNTIRYNQFFNACGNGGGVGEGCTAEIAAWGETGSGIWDNNKIYGNWFYLNRDENSGGTIVIGGNGSTWVGSPGSNNLIYNNTFAGYSGGWMAGFILVNGGSGNVCRNNLWYDVGTASASCNTTSNNVDASSSPFASYPSNLHLSSDGAGGAGYTLPSPYNTDMDGVTRGQGTYFDVGAYEYTTGTGDTTAPVVTITSPTSSSTYSTSSSTINIAGTALDAVGVTSVSWVNDRGGSGTCTGTTSWSQSNITLLPGVNILTITARDAANNSSTDTLTVTYIGTDTVPAQFTFTDIGNAARSTVYTSNTITVTGLDATATVTITGGTYSKNGGVYTSSAGTAFYGDTFAVRHTSSSSYATATNTVLTIGGVSDTYTTTTLVDPGDVVAPVCTITSPTSSSTYATATGTINLAGTASDAVGVVSVSWANDRGGSGTATGTTSWSKTGITLYPGVNVLTITARDAANNAGVDTLTVTYTPADSVAPVITITNPTSSATYETSSSTINLSGTASDAVGVTSVSWTNDRGGVGTCTGTTSWSQANIVLYSGANILTVTARDAANNAGTDILTVTYTPVAGGSPTTIKGVYLKGVRR